MFTNVLLPRTCRLKYVWSWPKDPFSFKRNLPHEGRRRALPRTGWHVMGHDLTFHPQAEKCVVGLHYWPVIAKSRSPYFWIKRKSATLYLNTKSWNLHLISLSLLYSEKWRKKLSGLGFSLWWLLDLDCCFRTSCRRVSVSWLLICLLKKKRWNSKPVLAFVGPLSSKCQPKKMN